MGFLTKLRFAQIFLIISLLFMVSTQCKRSAAESDLEDVSSSATKCDSLKTKFENARSQLESFIDLSRQTAEICLNMGGSFDPNDNGCSCGANVKTKQYGVDNITKLCNTSGPAELADSNRTEITNKTELTTAVNNAEKEYKACQDTADTSADYCTKLGGHLDGSRTCRCGNDFPAYKLGNDTCTDHINKQTDECTESGGFITIDNFCRCSPEFNPLPSDQKSCTQSAQASSATGACIIIDIRTKEVQATCLPDVTAAACDKWFSTVYQNDTKNFSRRIVVGQNCDAAKASNKPKPQVNTCGYIDAYNIFGGKDNGKSMPAHQMRRGVDGKCRDYDCPADFFTSAEGPCVLRNNQSKPPVPIEQQKECKEDQYRDVNGGCVDVLGFESRHNKDDSDNDEILNRFDLCPNTPYDQANRRPLKPVHMSGRYIGCSGGEHPIR